MPRRHSGCLLLVLQSGADPIVDGPRVREWFDRLESPSKRYVLYPEWGHLLDFEDDRQRYWDDVAGWLDSMVGPPTLEAVAS